MRLYLNEIIKRIKRKYKNLTILPNGLELVGEYHEYGKLNCIYYMDIKKEKFIHFTKKEYVSEILKSNKLLYNNYNKKFGPLGVYAISLTYGINYSGVQTTHIADKTDDLSAILFTTKIIPFNGISTEVKWKRDVVFETAKEISYSEAINLLRDDEILKGYFPIVFYDLKEANTFYKSRVNN